jgi:hypothetical protein
MVRRRLRDGHRRAAEHVLVDEARAHSDDAHSFFGEGLTVLTDPTVLTTRGPNDSRSPATQQKSTKKQKNKSKKAKAKKQKQKKHKKQKRQRNKKAQKAQTQKSKSILMGNRVREKEKKTKT